METTKQAVIFGCTVAQIKAQFVKNARQLRAMAQEAQRTSKKVNGYSADELNEMAARAERGGAN